MLSSVVNQGNRLASWKMTPTRSGSGFGIARPWQRMVPFVCFRSPAIIMRSEVLPQPLGPTITTKRPLRTVSETSTSAGTPPSIPA
jgi:hypothetical protein